MARTVLVTGAAGFVGSYLLHSLVADPSVSLIAWRRSDTADARSVPPRSFPSDDALVWQTVDILDRGQVTRALKTHTPSEVYHCAGAANVRGSWTNAADPFTVNVRGTQFLLEAIADVAPGARVLIPGSALVYRPSLKAVTEDDPLGPVSPYGVSKLAQEMLARQCAEDGLSVLVTRSFTHLGPGQALEYAASSFANQIARIEAGLAPPVIKVGALEAERDLTDVRDTVAAYVALMAEGKPNHPYNVCSGRSHRIQTVLETLLRLTGAAVQIQTSSDRLRPRDNDRLLGDRTRISDDTGWSPGIPLEQTLADLLGYWRGVVSSSA